MIRSLRASVWGYGIVAGLIVLAVALELPARGTWGMRLRGDRVMAVTPGGPADRAGIAVGDHVVAPPPAVPGARHVATLGDRTVLLVAAAPGASERARTAVALVLAAAFAIVGALALAARADRLILAFSLFAFSAALALAPPPVAPAWLAGPPGAPVLHALRLLASLLLPAALVEFFARFPEGRAGGLGRGLAVGGYAGALGLFGLGVGLQLSSQSTGAPAPAARFLAGGAFEALAALFLCGAMLAAVVTFVASYRHAAAHHRPRLTALVWSVTLGLVPLALLTLSKNVAPTLTWPGEDFAALWLLLVPAGFAYATVVHRVFDGGALLTRGGTRRALEAAGPARARGGTSAAATFAPLAQVLDDAAGELVRALGLEHCAVFAVSPAGSARLAALHGEAPRRRERMAEMLSDAAIARLSDARAPLTPGELALGEAGASLLVPLFAEDRCRAVLALGPRLSGPWFDAGEREEVAAFAREASARVENAVLHDRLVERAGLERDVQLARRIQERLLPHAAPVLPTVDLAGTTVPAGEIGGDYYDFLKLGPRTLGVAIADVCGKGLPAALLLAGVQAGLRSRVEDDLAPGAVLARVNEELVQLRQPEKFVCLAYARLDALRRTLTWANAGLNPPIVVHPDGRFEEVEHGGLILGVASGETYEEIAWTFERGSLIAFYTDGLTDALQSDTPFDPERLGEVLARNRGLRADRIAARALAAAADWHRDGPADDRTIVILKFL